MNQIPEKNKEETIMNQLLERLSSPISGTFFASFMLINWPLMFLIFDGKLTFAEKVSIVSHMSNVWTFLVCPFVAGFFYFVGMPYFLTYAKQFHDFIERKNILQNHRHKAIIENEKIFGEIKSSEINKACILSIRGNLTSLTSIKDRVDNLRTQHTHNSQLHNQLSQITTLLDGVIKKIEDETTQINGLNEIVRSHSDIRNISFESLKNSAKNSLSQINFYRKLKTFKS